MHINKIKMSFFFHILIFASLSINLFAQKKFDFDTTILVGKEKQIFQQRKIIVDAEGNIYVAGFYKEPLTIGNATISTNSPLNYFKSQAIFVAKYNSNNQFLWLKKIAECDTLNNFSWIIDKNSNFLFAIGYAGKFFYDADSIASAGSYDVLILNYDSSFAFRYKRHIGGINGERISNSCLAFDEQGNYFISGSYNNTWNGNFQNYKLGIGNDTITANNEDMFIAKFDSSGSALWAKSYGGSGIDLFSFINYSDDKIYLAGTLGSDNNNDIGGVNINFPVNYYDNCFIAKLDTNGNGIWVRRFGSKYNNALGSAAPRYILVAGSRVYFTGSGNDQNQLEFIFDGGPNLLGTGLSDYESFIAAYDTLGNFIFRTLVPDVNYLSQLTTDSSSNIIGVGASGYTTKVVSYDSIGDFNWKVFSDAAYLCTTVGSGIAKDSHGKLYVVGGTNCTQLFMGNDTLYPPANQSTMFFSSLDSIDASWAVGTNEPLNFNTDVIVYPNPASEMIVVQMPFKYDVVAKIEVQNALGQLFYSSSFSDRLSSISIDVSNYPKGIYFITYKSNRRSISKKLIINH